jgi:hypothetical protein
MSLLEDLEWASRQAGVQFCAFGDSAYPLHPNLQRTHKALPGMPLSVWDGRYNLLMSRFRIVVENIFAQRGQRFAFLQHTQNQRLGTSPCGQTYAVSAIMFNWTTILDGNQAASAHGYCAAADVSLEWYMEVDEDE